MNFPTFLTLLRILVIPLLVVIYYLPIPNKYLICALLFGAAALTDWLDGYLARRWDQMTPFGAFLDPVADKLMVAVALGVLIEAHASWIMTFPALVIIGREIVISALREWMAEIGERGSVAVSWIGKIKTTFQMLAIFLLLLTPPGTLLAWGGLALLYLAALLTLWSMISYLRAALPHLLPNPAKNP
ncbi:CDP-diacylglycerol--glycerol-3-phosphate 3-phosphatidyltransferase [Marinospirillum alkaliphilum]|uniref:CDP-diacylglycerol--glycerol-3-phosphate 3-phosphatidyltransferase n=1 Tax=Marinospirillum alkaliphilum DSM 21637 TaxID=1122209 RepID=A0A1K1XPT5_9GAMM|nr:CDP-diacylglycerol--glycerol-3-phosphate 3-phosphatidyltransferase [Marinospirillum alkaliphilum]SFX51076.1 CDP-diacylglycerol--glycerol-3-phosphate 3-phosphatidyltransferase [Marinospirillum alkaliphilum DSM 21637]